MVHRPLPGSRNVILATRLKMSDARGQCRDRKNEKRDPEDLSLPRASGLVRSLRLIYIPGYVDAMETSKAPHDRESPWVGGRSLARPWRSALLSPSFSGPSLDGSGRCQASTQLKNSMDDDS